MSEVIEDISFKNYRDFDQRIIEEGQRNMIMQKLGMLLRTSGENAAIAFCINYYSFDVCKKGIESMK